MRKFCAKFIRTRVYIKGEKEEIRVVNPDEYTLSDADTREIVGVSWHNYIVAVLRRRINSHARRITLRAFNSRAW